MELKRSQAFELAKQTNKLISTTSDALDTFFVTTDDIKSLSQAAKALAILYKLHVFIHQSSKSGDSSDLIASIDEEISRINKKYNELLLAATPPVDDEECNLQDMIESNKRLQELLGDEHEENAEDDIMKQVVHKKKKKNNHS